ncbi:MAG: C-GCAxxG-C-C family protein [Candidatus Thermoplasmatota archaeon]|nr:C-GCAxxG-C-C family protein [Candidatus Thermoplasmatota archaeon]
MDGSLPDRAYDVAFEYERRYGGCTQAVLMAVRETIGGIPDDVVRSGYTFAGGSALSGRGTCGALAGGLMAIGLLYGRPVDGFGKEREFRDAYRLSIKLYERFIEEYGSITCSDIQERIMGRSFDLRTREGNIEFEEAGGHEDKCTSVAGRAARWTVEILLRHSGPVHS